MFWKQNRPQTIQNPAETISSVENTPPKVKEKQVRHGFESMITGSGKEVRKRKHVLYAKEKFPETNHFLGVRYAGVTEDQKLIKAWEIGKDFLLWTVGEEKSDRVLILTHSGYRNLSKEMPVPDEAEINLFTPHDHALTG